MSPESLSSSAAILLSLAFSYTHSASSPSVPQCFRFQLSSYDTLLTG